MTTSKIISIAGYDTGTPKFSLFMADDNAKSGQWMKLYNGQIAEILSDPTNEGDAGYLLQLQMVDGKELDTTNFTSGVEVEVTFPVKEEAGEMPDTHVLLEDTVQENDPGVNYTLKTMKVMDEGVFLHKKDYQLMFLSGDQVDKEKPRQYGVTVEQLLLLLIQKVRADVKNNKLDDHTAGAAEDMIANLNDMLLSYEAVSAFTFARKEEVPVMDLPGVQETESETDVVTDKVVDTPVAGVQTETEETEEEPVDKEHDQDFDQFKEKSKEEDDDATKNGASL